MVFPCQPLPLAPTGGMSIYNLVLHRATHSAPAPTPLSYAPRLTSRHLISRQQLQSCPTPAISDLHPSRALPLLQKKGIYDQQGVNLVLTLDGTSPEP